MRPCDSRTRACLPLLLALLLAYPGLSHTSSGAWSPASVASAPLGYSLALVDRTGSPILRRIDPTTLSDLPSSAAIELGIDGDIWNVVVSGDGSTIAAVGTGKGGVAVVIRDALSGEERLRIPNPVASWMLALSDDGARLLSASQVITQAGDYVPKWQVYDTRSGWLLATFEGDSASEDGYDVEIDRDVRRLYRLTIPYGGVDPSQNTAPVSVRVIVTDLTTGVDAGRIDLPDVKAGNWQKDETIPWGGTEIPIPAQLGPAMALSLDGRRLAVVHADEDVVTIVDAERLAVERTVRFSSRTGWVERLVGLVPLWPQSSEAKMFEGALLDAVFAPDGRHLYLFGFGSRLEDDYPRSFSLGLRVIDLWTGDTTTADLGEARIDRVVLSPDGSAVYAIGGRTVDGQGVHLWRLDPRTLDALAERTFAVPPQILVLPSSG